MKRKAIIITVSILCVFLVIGVVRMLSSGSTKPINCMVGDYLSFGKFPQKAKGNDNTPIEWLVLARDENKALLLSRYCLDVARFNREYDISMTWKKCSLRSWLNDSFIYDAFTEEQQKAILSTSTSGDFSTWDTDNAKGSYGKVFLLSAEEANEYLGVSYESENIKARSSPTDYAKTMGAAKSQWKTAEGKDSCAWWLRTTGSRVKDKAAFVRSSGMLEYDTCNEEYCVRPAIWVDLDLMT